MFKRGISHLGIFFLTALSLLPLPVLYVFSNGIYVLIYHVFLYRKKIVRQNLRRSFPEKTLDEIISIEKKFYRYFSDLTVEVIKMCTISKRQLQKRYLFKNVDRIEHYFEKGESVLICSAHYGNWEWGNMMVGMTFSATNYAIYKPLSNELFDRWFHRIRSRFGTRMVAMRQTLRAFSSASSPNLFSFGNDQAPSKDESHYWTTFLNQASSIQLGIEKIARKSDRPIFYLKVAVTKRGYYEVDCIPLCLNPRDTAPFEITELHTRFLESLIKEEPAYWLWSHRRWKYKPQ